MLKLYTDKEFLTEENRSFVFPLLFDLHFIKDPFFSEYYKIVNTIEESDIVVFPLEYAFLLKHHSSYIESNYHKAKALNKTIWAYSGGDFGYSFDDESIFNFRLSGFKSKLNSNTIMMPSFINDPYQEHLKNGVTLLNKEILPKIGFVGHAKGGFSKYVKEFISYLRVNINRSVKHEYADYQPFYPSSVKRAKYLQQFIKSGQLVSNFIFRDKYRAGVKTDEHRAETTKEFYNNIFESPYTFCIRGGGNFSVRFYETLAVGRIPVLLDTDCLLPLSNTINWKDHCVIIDESDAEIMNQKLIGFHNNINNDEFISLQKKNRTLWENYLNRHAFFKVLHDDFITKIQPNEL